MGAFALEFAAMATVSSRPPRRPFVDFASVPVSQWAIHDRLINWSRWAHGDSGATPRTSGTAPGFELFRSSEAKRAYGEETTVPIDKEDAMKVAKGVGHLPPQKRRAIHWYYLEGGRHPSGKARELGVEIARLADLVRDGRTMLLEWRV